MIISYIRSHTRDGGIIRVAYRVDEAGPVYLTDFEYVPTLEVVLHTKLYTLKGIIGPGNRWTYTTTPDSPLVIRAYWLEYAEFENALRGLSLESLAPLSFGARKTIKRNLPEWW